MLIGYFALFSSQFIANVFNSVGSVGGTGIGGAKQDIDLGLWVNNKHEVNVHEGTFDSEIVDIAYLGESNEFILIRTQEGKAYRSPDRGVTWKDLADTLHGAKVLRFMGNRANRQVAILQVLSKTERPLGAAKASAQRLVFATTDGGNNFIKWSRTNVETIVFHPKRPRWALLSWWSGDCPGTHTTMPGPCALKLLLTKDLGLTFSVVLSHVLNFAWGSSDRQQEDRIYFTHFKDKTSSQPSTLFWSPGIDFSCVDVGAAGALGDIQELVPQGNVFVIAKYFVIVSKLEDEELQHVKFLVSNDGARNFRVAHIPGVGDLKAPWYAVLDASANSIAVHVDHEEDEQVRRSTVSDIFAGHGADGDPHPEGSMDVHWQGAEGKSSAHQGELIKENTGPILGKMYVSDNDGIKFTVSLENQLRSAGGTSAFQKIVNIEGVFLANTHVAANKHNADDVGSIQTVISFDKGGLWSLIKPPEKDSRGNLYECVAQGLPLEDCSLHLHVTTPEGDGAPHHYPPVYSTRGAVGIVLGIGNVGPTLRYEKELVSLFISRDAGLSWFESHQGGFIYEIADHGGIIAAADDVRATKSIFFSYDEGSMWYDMELTGEEFEVNNIVTQTDTGSVGATSVIVTGQRPDGRGILFMLDFSPALPLCQGSQGSAVFENFKGDTRAKQLSDYESWSPTDHSGRGCLFGVHQQYVRRKANAMCFHGDNFVRSSRIERCSCTYEDYMCEIGYKRNVGEEECVVESSFEEVVPNDCDGEYEVNKYRKLPGNACIGGWLPEKAEAIPCPSSFKPRSFKLFVIFLIVVVGCFHFWRLRHRPKAIQRPSPDVGSELPMIALHNGTSDADEERFGKEKSHREEPAVAPLSVRVGAVGTNDEQEALNLRARQRGAMASDIIQG